MSATDEKVWLGPTPAETREVIQDLINALADIRSTPRHGGVRYLSEARARAHEALRVMPMRYMPKDQPGVWVTERAA